MRFKIGTMWFQAAPGLPIMVELTDKDKSLIAQMPADATRYAMFDEDSPSVERQNELKEWMMEE